MVTGEDQMTCKFGRRISVAMKVSGTVNYHSVLWKDLFIFHISLNSDVMVSGKEPDIHPLPDRIKHLWNLRMLLPGHLRDRMFQITKNEQDLGICRLYTGKNPGEAIIGAAFKMPPSPFECTLDTEMYVSYHKD